MAAGGGLGTGGGNPIWSFVWFLGLIFCGWPLAGFCAGWYILILPFAVCFDGFTVSLDSPPTLTKAELFAASLLLCNLQLYMI